MNKVSYPRNKVLGFYKKNSWCISPTRIFLKFEPCKFTQSDFIKISKKFKSITYR